MAESLYKEWLDGMPIAPFHSWEQLRNTQVLFNEGIWRSAEISKSNKELLASLNRGAEAFVLRSYASELKSNLSGVMLNYLFGWYETEEPEALTEAYSKILQESELDSHEASSSLGFDPIEYSFTHIDFDLPSFLQGLSDSKWDVWTHRHFVDLRKYQNAGAPVDLQLAIALAAAYEHFIQHPNANPNHFHFAFAQGRDYLLEISKLRSFRSLWKMLLNELSIPTNPSNTFVSAENSIRYLSGNDPHSNLLRLTTNALSSVLGGADFVLLHPHTIDFSFEGETHLPINILHLIRFEAGIVDKQDRMAGSYTIEALTKAVSNRSWELFKEIEKEGGWIKSVQSGWVESRIKTAHLKEQELFNQGKIPIIGSDLFPFKLHSNKTKIPANSPQFQICRLTEEIDLKTTSK
jgi:methylmalonyl-CoA mutase